MTRTHSSKAFLEYLGKLGREKTIFEKAKKDLRLNQIEQSVLEAWNLLRSTEFEKILQITQSVSPDPLIQSQILLVRGIALHNSGEMQASVSLFEQAIDLMQGHEVRRMKFIAYFNLFNACQNLRLFSKLPSLLRDWKSLPLADLNEEIAIKRAEFRICLAQNKIQPALEMIHWLEEHSSEMSELNRLNFQIDLFDLFVKKQDFQSCELVLNKLKQFRSYHYGAHYKYLKKLLDFHLYQKPLYIYERDFQDNKHLFYELSVLKYLEEKNLKQASLYWSQLSASSPHLYLENFKFKVEDNLFALALKKLLTKSSSAKSSLELKTGASKEQKLLGIMQSQPSIEKHLLYEKIWGKAPESKSDLAKLQLMIFRLNQKGLGLIKYRKGCYYLAVKGKRAS